MNYSLCDLPESGSNPVVYMDITLKDQPIGQLTIRLFRDVFPAGVENFFGIASGKTYRKETRGIGDYQYIKDIRRSFDNCKFYKFLYGNYIVSGDIYNNNGTNAGTIFCDKRIPPDFGEFYYPHDAKGLVSLVPYRDKESGELFYDSTFMITLDKAKPTNILSDLDEDQIVIGQVISGIDIIDKMNELIKPYAGRRYPDFVINHAYTKHQTKRYRNPPVYSQQNISNVKEIKFAGRH